MKSRESIYWKPSENFTSPAEGKPDASGGREPLIARIEDMPYATSPPVQFVYESSATLNLGTYTWDDSASALTPLRPVLDNSLYYIRDITLGADISEADFTAAIVTTPKLYGFLAGDSSAPLFREPIQMVKFLENYTYRLVVLPRRGDEVLQAAFRGTLTQTANLVGKSSITLKAIISAQEVSDSNFVRTLREHYPTPENGGV